MENKICPNCGEECWRESCDVGVGVIYGPWGCPCGWSEDERYNLLNGPKTIECAPIVVANLTRKIKQRLEQLQD